MATQQLSDLSDPHSEFGNWIRFQLLRQTVDKPVHERLRNILEEVLKGRNPLINNLLEGLVYVVLNQPPATLRGGKRHFVAGVKWSNVDEHTKSCLKEVYQSTPPTPEAQGCEVFFVDSSNDGDSLRVEATDLWVQKWNEYWLVTQDGVARHQRYTWNHLLLKADVQPLPMGLCWNLDSASEQCGPYFRLSTGMAQTIGLPPLNSPDSIPQLLSLPRNTILSRNVNSAQLSELEPLLQLCNKIDEKGRDHRTLDTVAWKIFHLVRSYAVWGGKAFISIPIVIGTAEMSHTAVLSVCSKMPLSLQAYNGWQFMAEALLRPLIEEDMFSLVKEYKFADAAYSIGHPFKHRFNDLTGGVRLLDNQIGEFIREIKTDVVGPNRSWLLDHAIRILETADFVWSSSETCRRVSDLMNFISSFHAADLSTRLDDKYLARTPYWIADHLPSKKNCLPLPFVRWFKGKEKSVEVEADTIAILKRTEVRVEPFSTPWGHFRPFDSLYDELLYELLRNAAHYGFPDRCFLSIAMDFADPIAPALIFSNLCSQASLPNQLTPSRWLEWGTGREGGLRFFNEYLSITGSGSIHCKFDDIDTQPRFSVRLALSGLTSKQPTSPHNE